MGYQGFCYNFHIQKENLPMNLILKMFLPVREDWTELCLYLI